MARRSIAVLVIVLVALVALLTSVGYYGRWSSDRSRYHLRMIARVVDDSTGSRVVEFVIGDCEPIEGARVVLAIRNGDVDTSLSDSTIAGSSERIGRVPLGSASIAPQQELLLAVTLSRGGRNFAQVEAPLASWEQNGVDELGPLSEGQYETLLDDRCA